jgi:Fe-S cluster assembly ATPase SufC
MRADGSRRVRATPFHRGVRALKGDGRSVVLVGQDERVLAAVADRVEVWLDGVVVADSAPEGFLGAAISAARAEGLL